MKSDSSPSMAPAAPRQAMVLSAVKGVAAFLRSCGQEWASIPAGGMDAIPAAGLPFLPPFPCPQTTPGLAGLWSLEGVLSPLSR